MQYIQIDLKASKPVLQAEVQYYPDTVVVALAVVFIVIDPKEIVFHCHSQACILIQCH